MNPPANLMKGKSVWVGESLDNDSYTHFSLVTKGYYLYTTLMGAIFSRMVWLFVVTSLLSYATYLVAGNVAQAQASGENLPVLIRDELGAGVHHLSGMIMVASPCDQLSVRTQEVSSNSYILVFRTWHEPATGCVQEETPRYFRALLFAPSTGIEFAATLDEHSFPIVVLPTLPNNSPLE